jgi:hypothetical protein
MTIKRKNSHEDQARFNPKGPKKLVRTPDSRYLRNALRSGDISHLIEEEGDSVDDEFEDPEPGVFNPQFRINLRS